MTEKQLINFVKLVLLDGDNPRGKEAEENLKWGFKEYLKTEYHENGNKSRARKVDDERKNLGRNELQ